MLFSEYSNIRNAPIYVKKKESPCTSFEHSKLMSIVHERQKRIMLMLKLETDFSDLLNEYKNTIRELKNATLRFRVKVDFLCEKSIDHPEKCQKMHK